MRAVDLGARRVPATPFVDDQLDLMRTVEFTEDRPLIDNELLHAVGLGEHLVPLIVAEFQSMAGRAAVLVRRPTVQRGAGEIGPLLEEAPRPFGVVAVRPGG